MGLLIREAELADIEALTPLVGEVQALHVASRPETFRPMSADETATWLGTAFQNPELKIWIAEATGVACGYLLSAVRKQTVNPFVFDRTWLELDQICVHPAYRRRGVAKALVETALAHAEAQGIRDVELSTWVFNHDAQRAFARLGFVPKVVRFEARKAERAPETSNA